MTAHMCETLTEGCFRCELNKDEALDYALAKRLHRKHKGALTRATKVGNRAVVKACRAFFDEFREHDLPLPDDWHRWERAQSDALHGIMRDEGPSW
jgi:hypothetical protein